MTFHKVPVHDRRSACLTVQRVFVTKCGGLIGWWHFLFSLKEVANHDAWGEMDSTEKIKKEGQHLWTH